MKSVRSQTGTLSPRRHFRKSRGSGAAGAFLIAGLLIGLWCPGTVPAAPIAPHAKAISEEFETLAEMVSPAVVHISAERVIKQRGGMTPGDMLEQFFGEEFSRRFGQQAPEQEYRQRGLGSGFIVSKDGYVLTNNHVVEKADELKVKLADRREFDAKVVGTDPDTDIAVLKIDGTDFPTAELGDSDSIKVGHFILAIGNPFGLDRTVSVGIISAKGRSGVGISEYEDFIQTDAAINMGNSGGPIIDMDGKVIGISTAILSSSGGSVGIGFAVPVNMAKSVMDAIIKEGRVTRGYLGVSIQDLTPDLAGALNLKQTTGALVTEVLKDTPAGKAGIEREDLITAINGKEVNGALQLRNMVASDSPGTDVTLTVIRNGSEKSIKVTVGKRPVETEVAQAKTGRELGFEITNLTDDIRQQYDIEEDHGVLVTTVDPASHAHENGLRPGAVIIEVNRRPVENVEEFERQVAAATGKNLLLLVKHQGGTRYIVVPAEESE